MRLSTLLPSDLERKSCRCDHGKPQANGEGWTYPSALRRHIFMASVGWRVMKKVMDIIRQEMDAIGGQEFQLPALNPVEIWEQTGRVESFGDTLFHMKNRPLVLAPTHEEIFTTIAKDNIKSYRDLPQIWYQIQTKFRNEPRPRSGMIRGRQFFMKDSYSFR